jgi:ABC-type bacteriocin/lantibiotic exporter with double-glycine peptidase domain
MARRSRPKFSKESTKKALRVFKFIKPYRTPFIFGMLVLLISTVAMLAFPRILGNLMDAVKGSADQEVIYFIQILIGLFFIIGVSAFLRIYLFGIVAHKSLALLKTQTYKHLISSPMSFFSRKRVGELSSRISTDISLIQETFTITIAELVRQMITIPVGLFFLIYISGRLTVFIIALIPVIALIGIFFGKFIKKLSVVAQDDITESNKVVDEKSLCQ